MKRFNTVYTQKTKHRKKCRECGKLIKDGERVHMEQVKIEKLYPVKGLMGFTRWHYWHETCARSR